MKKLLIQENKFGNDWCIDKNEVSIEIGLQ